MYRKCFHGNIPIICVWVWPTPLANFTLGKGLGTNYTILVVNKMSRSFKSGPKSSVTFEDVASSDKIHT